MAIWTFRAGGSSNLEELFWQLQLSNLAGLQKNSIFSAETSFLSRSNTFLHWLPARQVIKLHTLIYVSMRTFSMLVILRIQFKLNTALLSTVRPCVRAFVTGVTSHISHIYKGINAMLIIRGPIKHCIFWIKIILAIFLAKTRPDKAIFSDLTNLTIDFDFELSKI